MLSSHPLFAPKFQLYVTGQLSVLEAFTVKVLVCGVPQVKETELGAKVNVGFGLLIVM